MAENHQSDEQHDDVAVTVPRGVGDLVGSAARWMHDALDAWSEDDYAKVAVLAPLAVEHLGKAVLWKENPVLVVPLLPEAEAALMSLATNPDLASPKLRTVGLAILLRRIERLLGGLPIDNKQRTRMVEIRNGAMHVGSPAQSRYVLLDALTVCSALLVRLGEDLGNFYGDHHSSVIGLMDVKRTEVGHRVAAKTALARRRLGQLEDRLGEALFEQITRQFEAEAVEVLDPNDFGMNLWGVDTECPECGSKGRLFGSLDATPEVEYDSEPLGGGEYESWAYFAGWSIGLSPQAFACNVCRLTLHGLDELSGCQLPASRYEVTPEDLGPDFDPAEFAEREYGFHD
jgi:hypothetical protein